MYLSWSMHLKKLSLSANDATRGGGWGLKLLTPAKVDPGYINSLSHWVNVRDSVIEGFSLSVILVKMNVIIENAFCH